MRLVNAREQNAGVMKVIREKAETAGYTEAEVKDLASHEQEDTPSQFAARVADVDEAAEERIKGQLLNEWGMTMAKQLGPKLQAGGFVNDPKVSKMYLDLVRGLSESPREDAQELEAIAQGFQPVLDRIAQQSAMALLPIRERIKAERQAYNEEEQIDGSTYGGDSPDAARLQEGLKKEKARDKMFAVDEVDPAKMPGVSRALDAPAPEATPESAAFIKWLDKKGIKLSETDKVEKELKDFELYWKQDMKRRRMTGEKENKL